MICATIALSIWLFCTVAAAKTVTPLATINHVGLMFLLVVLLAAAFVVHNIVTLVWSLF